MTTTPNDALTAALEITAIILRSNSIPEGEGNPDADDPCGDLIFDAARDEYGALRVLLFDRLPEFDPAARETKLIKNLMDIGDDHFDF